MPCCSTSLIRLIRRSTRNTPSGGPATDSARQPARARRMKPSANGSSSRSASDQCGDYAAHAGTGGAVSAQASAASRACRMRAAAAARSAVAPQPSGVPGQQQRLRDSARAPGRGRAAPAITVRPVACQPSTSAIRSASVRASTALNGSSSSSTGASCTIRRANSTRWNCPAESVPTGRALEAAQADRGQRRFAPAPRPALPIGAERAAARATGRGRPRRDSSIGKAAVERVALRQQRHPAAARRPRSGRTRPDAARPTRAAASSCRRRSARRSPSGCPARTGRTGGAPPDAGHG